MKMNGTIEYKMTAEMAAMYLKARKGADKQLDPQPYLCKVVNEEFGIKGECTKVLFF